MILAGWFTLSVTELQASALAVNYEENITPADSLSEEEKVNYLLLYLEKLPGAVFIRNGKEYSPQKAAEHLLSKWNKHKERVKTAQGFVKELATLSKSDEPYQIRFQDGHLEKCGELLQTELNRIEI